MPTEPNEQAERWDARELAALYLLTDPDQYPPVWSIADIGREIDYFDPAAVVEPLCRAGLLHRLTGNFVVATPAAYRMVQMVGQVA
ncbi:MAG TPA: hypothetical protein VGF95_14180 [Solirubrobacteraceae bacterium]|jgi:hypothetical protein